MIRVFHSDGIYTPTKLEFIREKWQNIRNCRLAYVVLFIFPQATIWVKKQEGNPQFMLGFCEAVLGEEGIEIAYVEPANTIVVQDIQMNHAYRERERRFFRRRDLAI